MRVKIPRTVPNGMSMQQIAAMTRLNVRRRRRAMQIPDTIVRIPMVHPMATAQLPMINMTQPILRII